MCFRTALGINSLSAQGYPQLGAECHRISTKTQEIVGRVQVLAQVLLSHSVAQCLSLPEVAYVFCSNMHRDHFFTKVFGNSLFVAAIRFILGSFVLPSQVRSMCMLK